MEPRMHHSLSWVNQSNKANYFFLMQVGNYSSTDSIDYNLVRITLTGCGLSMVGTMLSLFLICFLPLKSDGLFVVGNQCFALLIAQLSFIAAENSFPMKVMCKLSTSVLHYFFLTIHFWSLAYSLYLIIKAKRWNITQAYRVRTLFMVVGWLAPAFIVAVTAVIRGDTYGNDSLCWLSRHKMTRWAFVGPVVVILFVNFAIMIAMMLTRLVLDVNKGVSLLKKIKHQFLTAASLIPVLSLTWVFGVPSAALNTGFIYMFVIFNSSQGFWLFLGHMIGSQQIRSLLFSKPLQENGVMKSEMVVISEASDLEVKMSKWRELAHEMSIALSTSVGEVSKPAPHGFKY
ncbi:adhesion G-protein coupled receptor D1-like isoform X1 [Haliotis asinina]|uniref:adhesion G-protein coupled receptor D1-like isoform X1 n=1 Tax=Haliotis asinina TaxID=109174 RepID=UPI003531E8DF